jgi:hypothetical protein
MWNAESIDYLCYGVRTRSRIAVGYPRASPGGQADVTIEPGRVEGPELAADREADFFVEGGHLILVVRGVGRFLAAGGRSVVVEASPGAAESAVRLYLTGSVLGAIWLQRGLLPLHASAVQLPGGACVAFAGVSGAGKSSLAAHFAQAGHRIVADDVCVLAERDGGYSVWPGPARVKLAPDAVASLNRDSSVLERAGGTREKYHLEAGADAAGRGEPVPLSGIFLLSWGDGPPRTIALKGLDAVDVVGGHTYRQEFVRPLGLEAMWLRGVANVARVVPVSRLIRPHGHAESDSVIEEILAVVEGGRKPEVEP